jgi:hypothetical protein
VAHIDVQDGILTVDGTTRYSSTKSENMPGLDTAGNWVRTPKGGLVGQSKNANRGQGLDRYAGHCQPAAKPRKKKQIRTLAEANEVLVSSTLRDLVIGSGLEFHERGAHQLKGVPGQWRLFAVASPWAANTHEFRNQQVTQDSLVSLGCFSAPVARCQRPALVQRPSCATRL